jgi:hypothetical protein
MGGLHGKGNVMSDLPDWKGFSEAIMQNWQEHGDIDAFDKFELAVKFHLLKEVEGGFDPGKHIDAYSDCQRGDPWFEWNTRAEPSEADILAHPKVRGLVEALERIAHASDVYGVEANAEDQGADTLAYAHKSTCRLARAALAAMHEGK